MNNENSNCCNTDKSDCNTQETNCCTSSKVATSNIKKKAGIGILLLAVTFAIISAFSPKSTSEKSSCSGETSCETSCETGSSETSCCSKK